MCPREKDKVILEQSEVQAEADRNFETTKALYDKRGDRNSQAIAKRMKILGGVGQGGLHLAGIVILTDLSKNMNTETM